MEKRIRQGEEEKRRKEEKIRMFFDTIIGFLKDKKNRKRNYSALGAVFIVIIILILIGVTREKPDHTGEAITPSSNQKGNDYQEVIDGFEEKGFVNIKTEVLEDLIIGWLIKDGEVESVSVDGEKDYSLDAWYRNDVEVVIAYHTFPLEDKKPEPTSASPTTTSPPSTSPASTSPAITEAPQKENSDEAAKVALESTFPVKNAKRAAVVAITNSLASDVFKEDGNTYDVSKFHSYADTSGNATSYFFRNIQMG